VDANVRHENRIRKTRGRRAYEMLVIGAGLGALVWVLGAFADAYVFREGTLLEELAFAGAHEVWDLGVPIFLLLLFGLYARFVVARRERAEEALASSEKRFRSLVQNASDVITILDADGRVRYVSPSVERVLGYSPEQYLGQDVFDYVHSGDVWEVRNAFAEILRREGISPPMEYRMRRADGAWRYFEANANNMTDDPSVGGVVLNAWDVTERKALENELSHQAFYDPLTDLPNRALFMDRLAHALARAQRRRSKVAVMFLDLDNFKFVNDSLGHEAGDQLLVAVGERLLECLRPEDTLSRFGGDEFTVLLEGTTRLHEATGVAERIADALRAPFTIDGRDLYVTASIGISVSAGRERPGDLLRNADLAMYRTKRGGKDNYSVFDPSVSAHLPGRLSLERDLRRAVERGEFVVHYQPEVLLETGEIAGFEALVRWEHPERGLMPPAEFVPLAEETGLIVAIGGSVLREACRQAQRWLERNPEALGDTLPAVSVNLSPRQFRHPDLVQDVARVLRETSLSPRNLGLEVTESSVMDDAMVANTVLRQLRDLGVQLAIDDFGTGYSSLSRLKHLPVDALKIDRSFVAGIGEDAEDEVLISGVTNVAAGLGLSAVAEGVETPAQAARLRALGCRLAQGYYFSGPLPSEEVPALLAASPRRWLA
jgi:diguanylate cyclase (GGDEF)-like protein/PAS domain S-box-containing protein